MRKSLRLSLLAANALITRSIMAFVSLEPSSRTRSSHWSVMVSSRLRTSVLILRKVAKGIQNMRNLRSCHEKSENETNETYMLT